MGIVRDEDVGVWVCPWGSAADVAEFPAVGPVPRLEACGTHGEKYFKRCPNESCQSPLYHPSDLDRKFHPPCGAAIPWAERRWNNQEALMEADPFGSRLVGTGSYMGKSEPVKKEPVTSGITWDELEKIDRSTVGLKSPGRAGRGLSAAGKWVLGILASVVAGVILLLIRSWLISRGVVSP